MRYKALYSALLLGALFLPSALNASSDISDCEGNWKLASSGLACVNRAYLTPGNDSRVNLFALMRDQQGLALYGKGTAKTNSWTDAGRTFFAWGDLTASYVSKPRGDDAEGSAGSGSRCDSLAAGTMAFTAALAANRAVTTAERTMLGKARERLVLVCAERDYDKDATRTPLPDWPSGLTSQPGREYLTYLQASEAFYGGKWGQARDGFAGLIKVGDAWLADTSAYMQIRVGLNAAIASSLNDYGDLDFSKIDKTLVDESHTALDAYLARYPKGLYAGSAQGLRRRIFWLAGDMQALGQEYARLLGQSADPLAASQLINEIDYKVMIGQKADTRIDAPLLLASLDLMQMRTTSQYEGAQKAELSAAQLASQKGFFTKQPALYDFLTASYAFYVENDPRKVLTLIPDAARQASFSPLQFSRQMLRGMALAALHDRNEAGFWLEMLPGAKAAYQRPSIELALAINYERHGKLADVFAEKSPIQESEIREILLRQSAGPDILRAEASNAGRPDSERAVAIRALLEKDVVYGRYAGFAADLALIPKGVMPLIMAEPSDDPAPWRALRPLVAGKWSDGYACPEVRVTAAALASNPMDSKARLCLGDFYRLNDISPGYIAYTYTDDGKYVQDKVKPDPDILGNGLHLFPGLETPRSAFYTSIIADAKAPADDRAYALYRAVYCYAPSGFNDCGGVAVGKSQRKAWYDQLKRQYPTSAWAKKLRFYW